MAIALGAVARHEFEAGIYDAPLHRQAGQTIAKHLARALADEIARHVERREGWHHLSRDCEIVEASNRDAFGDRKVPALAFEKRTDSDRVRGTEHRTDVGMALNGPPVSTPGLGSHVSS